MKRTFAIGDIHGEYDKLIKLISKAKIDFNTDKLIFLGDYIDRGPKSKEVLEYLIELQQCEYDIVFLRGNHEQMLLDHLNNKPHVTEIWLYNGGYATKNSYKDKDNNGNYIPIEHVRFINDLPYYYEYGNYYFVHAGFQPGYNPENCPKQQMLWIRDEFIYSDYDWGKKVVFGHTPQNEPLFMDNKIGIDTGATFNRMLTAIELPSEKVVQVK